MLSEYRWPIGLGGLLAMSVIACGVLVWVATRPDSQGVGDGHVQVGGLAGIDGIGPQEGHHQHRDEVQGHDPIGRLGGPHQAQEGEQDAGGQQQQGGEGRQGDRTQGSGGAHRMASSTRFSRPSWISRRAWATSSRNMKCT